uniref:Small EDRK-rich factor-like N-terminal domain-containing protein n=1 Tax=Poecilia reticulata TaxID=8081 RepID=A0A3P9Q3R6_POERE
MARGHQKFQSQQKNAKKQAEIKKSKGHDQKAAAKAALVYTCSVCRVCKLYASIWAHAIVPPRPHLVKL